MVPSIPKIVDSLESPSCLRPPSKRARRGSGGKGVGGGGGGDFDHLLRQVRAGLQHIVIIKRIRNDLKFVSWENP